MQDCDKQPSVLPLTWLHSTPANDSVPAKDAPVKAPLSVPRSMEQTLLPPSTLLQTTAEAACSPSSIAPPSLNVTAPQAMLPQRADVLPLVGAAHAVSRQDKPQHVAPTLQQPQPATSGAASPQPATPEADQPKPAAQSAGFKKEELNGVTSQTSEPQPVSSELASTGVASSSGAAQPQLATSVEAQPQRAMAHVLDMLFPAELPAQSPSSSSLAAGSRPALAEHTGQADTLLQMPVLSRLPALW